MKKDSNQLKFTTARKLVRDVKTINDIFNTNEDSEDVMDLGIEVMEKYANSIQDKYKYKDPTGTLYVRNDPREMSYNAANPIKFVFKSLGENLPKYLRNSFKWINKNIGEIRNVQSPSQEQMKNFRYRQSGNFKQSTIKNTINQSQSQNLPKKWEDFLNSAKDSDTNKFSKLEPAKYDLSNKPIAGVANNTGSADITQMLVSYPAPTVSVGRNSWLSSLGSILSGAANIISAGVGIAAGLGNIGAGTPTGMEPNITENLYPTGAWDAWGNPVKFHDGGKVVVPKYKGGRNEMIAILQGGETVRTEAQENELQESQKKDALDAIAPLVSGENKDDPYAQVFGSNSSKKSSLKTPVLSNKTRADEEMIISIVAEAWRTNRSGFRNALRYS